LCAPKAGYNWEAQHLESIAGYQWIAFRMEKGTGRNKGREERKREKEGVEVGRL